MLKKPKFELGKLMEQHGEGGSSGKAARDETGAKVERADGYGPPVQESV
jgi:small subunit ribosomal protein S3Ae